VQLRLPVQGPCMIVGFAVHASCSVCCSPNPTLDQVSFFQSICVLGYCVFPLTVAAILCMGVGWSGCTSTVCLFTR